MATTNKSEFNWDAYNAVMTGANSGLKLFLAQQLLQDVQEVMVRFKSPLREDIDDITDKVIELRENNKKYLASRQAKSDEYKRVVVEDNRGTDDTKLTSIPHTTSVDGGRLSDTSGPQATIDRIERALGSAPL
jgi:NAD(P)-dependent dehydrogenase (short-subunit alcohol dehydrogenase family)